MRTNLVKTWSAWLLAAAVIGFASLPAAADDVVVARVNGVDIKQSDLDFASSEVGSRLASLPAGDRNRVLLQYVIENELMAGAGQTDSLDKADTFQARVKYHERRALRDAFFDAKITGAVSEADAKQIYDAQIGQLKPEQEVHARHILVATEAEAKEVAERLKKGEDFAAVAKEKSKDPGAEGGDLGFFLQLVSHQQLVAQERQPPLEVGIVGEVLLVGGLRDHDDIGEVGDQMLALGLGRRRLHIGAHVLFGEREIALLDVDAVDAGDDRVGCGGRRLRR